MVLIKAKRGCDVCFSILETISEKEKKKKNEENDHVTDTCHKKLT